MQVSNHIEKKIKEHVHRDVSPSDGTAYRKSGIAFFFGGTLSLLLCGQFGMGLTSVASNINHTLHHSIGSLWCAAICGALFSIVPVLVLRVLSSPMQFRALLRKKWQPQLLWTVSIGVLLSYHGDFVFEFLAVIVWSTAAYAVFRSMGEAIDLGYSHFKIHSKGEHYA